MLAQCLQSRATQLHAQNKSLEYPFHGPLHFGLASIPTSAVDERRRVALRANHDYSVLVRLPFGHIAAHYLFKSLREKLISQVVAIEGHCCESPGATHFVGLQKNRVGQINVLVASLHPVSLEKIRSALHFHFLQFLGKFVVFQFPPALHHLGQVLGLMAKTGIIFQPVRLGPYYESIFWVVKHQMSNIWMRRKDSVESLVAGLARRRKFTANVVCEFVCFVVNLLFRNSQDLAEVTLNSRFHGTVSLDRLQMPRAQDDQGGRGQDDCQLQEQHHSGPSVSWSFGFHPELLIRALTWISPEQTYFEETQQVSNSREKT